MEEKTNIPKPKAQFSDLLANWATARFASFYFVYRWLGTEDAKATLVDASNIQYFAILKAVILLCAMASALLCGKKLFDIGKNLKKTIKIVDLDDDSQAPK
jgi:hypothetical protein